jgi:N-acetylgalactosamine kinase
MLAVCDSGIEAPKTARARDQFNHRVACYHLGLRLVKSFFPQYVPLLHHLRDINTSNLGVPLSAIYKILLRLPEQATRDQLAQWLPADEIEPLLATHRPPADGLYPIRGVVLFGLAECQRSRLFAGLLQAGRVAEIGRLMRISHDGDRVTERGQDGRVRPFRPRTSNGYLLDLIEDLESGEPERVVRAQLQVQPGSYGCSTPEIDHMVDVSLATPGVVGAQLAGAGLGGCMMVLAGREAMPRLLDRLEQEVYRPAGRQPAVLLCKPIAGSGVLLHDALV